MIRTLLTTSVLAMLASQAAAVPIAPQEVSDTLAIHGATNITVIPSEENSNTKISGAIDGVNFVADVRDCEDDGATCTTVLFFANFNLSRDVTHEDYIQANAYNDTYAWGRAYVLAGEIGIDYPVDLFDENEFGKNEIETWQLILNSYKEHIATDDEDKSRKQDMADNRP